MKKMVDYIKRKPVSVLPVLPVLCLVILVLVSLRGEAMPADTRGNLVQEDVVWYVPTDEKVIALTFDDGPDPVFTKKVLDVLKKYDVHATFFVIGKNVDAYPDTARLIVERGNEIANHTYTHANLEYIGTDKLKEEITRTQDAIFSATDARPCLFRPPYGNYNDSIVDIVRDMGYKIVLWSWTQDTVDWCNPGTNYIITKVLSNAQNGDIIIFHDSGGDRGQTVMALEPIILGLMDQNFQIVTVSELLTHEGKDTHVLSGFSQDVFIYE